MSAKTTPKNALGAMADTLRDYGFSERQVIELVRYARQGVAAGLSHRDIMLGVTQQPAYIARFPGAAQLRGTL